MKVIILAAGCGTRLLPYTKETPKCMVKLANKPLLHHQIETLHSVGLEDITVVGGYCADKINGQNIKKIINKKFDSTNMVSTLFCAESLMTNGEDLLITYGDIIYEARVLENILKSKASISVCVDKNWMDLWQVRMEDPLLDAETLKLKDGNKITELGKKPQNIKEIQGQYMGLIKISGGMISEFKHKWHNLDRNVFYDGKDFHNMFMTSFIQQFIDSGIDVEAAFTDGGWLEIDSNKDLELYNKLFFEKSLNHLIKI